MIGLPEIIVEGDIMVELSCPIDQFPERDQTLVLSPERGTLGGGAINLCWYLGQLGVRAKLHSFVGPDGQDRLLDILDTADINGSGVHVLQVTTNLLVMFIHEGSSRSLYFPSNIERHFFERLLPAFLSNSMVLFTGSRNSDFQESVIDRADRSQATLLFLPSYTLFDMSPSLVKRYLRRASISIFNRTESAIIRKLSHVADLANLSRELGSVIVETRDREGAVLHTPEESITLPSYANSSDDVVGAGDGFAAGLVYAISKGMSWVMAGGFGSRVAAQIVERGKIRTYLDQSALRSPAFMIQNDSRR